MNQFAVHRFNSSNRCEICQFGHYIFPLPLKANLPSSLPYPPMSLYWRNNELVPQGLFTSTLIRSLPFIVRPASIWYIKEHYLPCSILNSICHHSPPILQPIHVPRYTLITFFTFYSFKLPVIANLLIKSLKFSCKSFMYMNNKCPSTCLAINV